MDESENENADFVLEVSDPVLPDKRNIQLLKRKLIITGFIHPTPGNIHGNENEVQLEKLV